MNFTATVSYADETRMVAIMPGAGAVMEAGNGQPACNFISTKHPIGPCSKPWKIRYAPKATAWPNYRDILLGTSKSRFPRELYPAMVSG